MCDRERGGRDGGIESGRGASVGSVLAIAEVVRVELEVSGRTAGFAVGS